MQEIKELLTVINGLQDKYKKHNRKFTLDGKLIGDIGEVLAAEKYGLELCNENEHVHDAWVEGTDPKQYVQIKASMNNNFYFPNGKETSKYFLCIAINSDGEPDEVFNGTSAFIAEHYIKKHNLKAKNTPYKLSVKRLRELNDIKDRDKLAESQKQPA